MARTFLTPLFNPTKGPRLLSASPLNPRRGRHQTLTCAAPLTTLGAGVNSSLLDHLRLRHLRGHGPRVVGHHPSTIRARRCVRTRPASAPSSPLARRARRSRAACPRVHALASLIAAPLGARTQAHEPWEPVQRSQRVRAARRCGPRSTRCADDPPYPRTSRESGAQQDASPDAALLTPSATG